jgi:glycerol-3-phosphate dehydrogenase
LISNGGLITIVGGKWTTYRKMAEDTMNHAITLAGWEPRPCVTESLKLHGWTTPEDPHVPSGLEAYGSEAIAIRALIKARPELGEPLHLRFPYPKACVVWGVRHEQARTLEDVLARRTRLLFLDAKAAVEAAPVAAQLMASELQQSPEWEETQVKAFTELAAGYCVPD